MANKKILLGLTTTSASNWKDKIREIIKFNIKEVSIFPTTLKHDERKELYELLENSPIEVIPHAHLRSDMDIKEINYLKRRFKTKVFNIHSEKEYPLVYNLSAVKSLIFVENTILPGKEEFEKFGGICIDFSHWHDEALRKNKRYDNMMHDFVKKYKIGCCHISAIKNKPIPDAVIKHCLVYASHKLDDLSEIDYVKKYNNYIPDIVSIELENSFEEQIKVKEYLEKIIDK